MRDVELGEVQLVKWDVPRGRATLTLRVLDFADARTGQGYLSQEACDLINARCDEFFRRKKMKTGKDYVRCLNKI